MPKKPTYKAELARLRELYAELPANVLALYEGMLENAARLRVIAAEAWEDIQENGRIEEFCQSDKVEPYTKERPAVKQFFQADKQYQAIIKALDEKLPKQSSRSKLAELMEDDGK